MFLRTACALLLTALPALAQPAIPPEIRAIHDALRLPEVLDLMSREGAEHGQTLGEALFGEGRVPRTWTETVAHLHDPARLDGPVLATLAAELAGEDTAAILGFLNSPPGQAMAELELAAREALLDDEAEQQAKEAAAVALAEGSPRLDLLQRYAEANDLVDSNVAATMNASLAYATGLRDGGGMSPDATEDDLLADVWSQEPRIRAETTEWITAFLLKAYEPASDEDIEALIAFSETPPGQALNRAIFDAFDAGLSDVSRSLGLAAARFSTTQEL